MLQETEWWFLEKLNIVSPYDPVIPLLNKYPKELKAETQGDICIWVFMAILFTIATTWKQHQYPEMGEWVNKIWCRNSMDGYSLLKRKAILTHITTYINLATHKKTNIVLFHLQEVPRFLETDSWLLATSDGGRKMGYKIAIEKMKLSGGEWQWCFHSMNVLKNSVYFITIKKIRHAYLLY